MDGQDTATQPQWRPELFDAVPAPALLVTGGGRIETANRRACALLERAPEALRGRRLEEIFPAQAPGLRRLADAPGSQAELEVAGPGARRLLLSLGGRVGGACLVLLREGLPPAPLSGPDELVRDCALVFELPDVGIAFLRGGRLVRANGAFLQLAGCRTEELAALDAEALFGVDPPALRAEQERALQAEGRWSGERLLCRRDGSQLRVLVSRRRVAEGDPDAGVIVSCVNVEARFRAEQALLQLADRTRTVLDSVLVGIVTVGPEGIRWMNRSARRMFGGDLPDFLGQPLGVVATPGPQHPFREAQVHAALEEGQARTFECRVLARDGRDFWVVGNVVRTDGELTYALLDIDRRRRAEQRMAEAQASLQRLIELAPLGIVLCDAQELRLLQANPAAAALFGRPVEALRGRTVEEVFAGATAAALHADMRAALAEPGVTQREYRLEAPGQPVVIDARYLPLARPGAPPDQLLLVAADVTEQRAAQQARLEEALSQRDLLVKEVHHRIKNNLQGVAGLLQQIAAGKPEVAPAIGEVVGQVRAIAQVYGLQVGAVGALRLHEVLEAITGSVQKTFDRPIVLELEEGGHARGWVLPEAEAIPIALTVNELLTNAIKHSARDAPVRCRLCRDDAGVRIEVWSLGRLPEGFSLERLRGGVSGLGLVRALLPRRHAQLSLQQQGAQVRAAVRLVPPSVLRAGPDAAAGTAPAAPRASE